MSPNIIDLLNDAIQNYVDDHGRKPDRIIVNGHQGEKWLTKHMENAIGEELGKVPSQYRDIPIYYRGGADHKQSVELEG